MDSAAVKWLALSLCLVIVQAQSRQKWFSEGQKTLADALAKRHNEGVAKNIVFFLGDGMGVSTITAARILKGQNDGGNGEEYKLTMEKLPFTGLIKTYNTNQQVPDSAGTATSFYTGVKTRAGVLGVDESVVRDDCTNLEDGALETIQDWALKEGKSVGLVSTARITHATPGAAYAKIPDRDWECDADIRGVNCDGKVKDIALQLIDNYEQIQVLMGGGRRNFIPRETPDPGYPTTHGSRADGRDLVQEWKDKQAALGRKFEYVWNNDQLKQVDTNQTDSLFGLFNPSHMTYDHDRQETGQESEPSIADMTAKAIEILSKNDKGFFLLVEGGRIDHGHHSNYAHQALQETIAMDEAVGVALNMTDESDTLTVVTADHSHVFAIAGYPERGSPILGFNSRDNPARDNMPMTTLIYGNGPGPGRTDLTNEDTTDYNFRFPNAVSMSSETHGGEDVAVFAQGPMAHLVVGCNEQNFLAHFMAYASCVGTDKSHCDDVTVIG